MFTKQDSKRRLYVILSIFCDIIVVNVIYFNVTNTLQGTRLVAFAFSLITAVEDF